MSTRLTTYLTKYYERLDQICVRRYGSSANDVVVYVLNKNPGLEAYGIVLPSGITISLPDLPVSSQIAEVRRQIYLWN